MRFLLYFLASLIFNVACLSLHGYTQVEELMEKGKKLVQTHEYEEANLVFKKIMTIDQEIPSEFCFYFATSLYHTGQFRNSRSFIDKYYDLAGREGKLAGEIAKLEILVDGELAKIDACELCDENGQRLVECYQCKGEGEILEPCPLCKAKGNIICDICSGNGVLVRKSILNTNEYQTCPKCQGSGIIPCPKCGGQKELKVNCRVCSGLGKTPTGGLCDHAPVN